MPGRAAGTGERGITQRGVPVGEPTDRSISDSPNPPFLALDRHRERTRISKLNEQVVAIVIGVLVLDVIGRHRRWSSNRQRLTERQLRGFHTVHNLIGRRDVPAVDQVFVTIEGVDDVDGELRHFSKSIAGLNLCLHIAVVDVVMIVLATGRPRVFVSRNRGHGRRIVLAVLAAAEDPQHREDVASHVLSVIASPGFGIHASGKRRVIDGAECRQSGRQRDRAIGNGECRMGDEIAVLRISLRIESGQNSVDIERQLRSPFRLFVIGNGVVVSKGGRQKLPQLRPERIGRRIGIDSAASTELRWELRVCLAVPDVEFPRPLMREHRELIPVPRVSCKQLPISLGAIVASHGATRRRRIPKVERSQLSKPCRFAGEREVSRRELESGILRRRKHRVVRTLVCRVNDNLVVLIHGADGVRILKTSG